MGASATNLAHLHPPLCKINNTLLEKVLYSSFNLIRFTKPDGSTTMLWQAHSLQRAFRFCLNSENVHETLGTSRYAATGSLTSLI
ncbi:hypothetical protein YC2023_055033 [Brassica napus]